MVQLEVAHVMICLYISPFQACIVLHTVFTNLEESE